MAQASCHHGGTSCFPCWPPSVAKAFSCFCSYHKPTLLLAKDGQKEALLAQGQTAGYEVSRAEVEGKGREKMLHFD